MSKRYDISEGQQRTDVMPHDEMPVLRENEECFFCHNEPTFTVDITFTNQLPIKLSFCQFHTPFTLEWNGKENIPCGCFYITSFFNKKGSENGSDI